MTDAQVALELGRVCQQIEGRYTPSRRDYFAAAVISSMLANVDGMMRFQYSDEDSIRFQLARRAVLMADVMIAVLDEEGTTHDPR